MVRISLNLRSYPEKVRETAGSGLVSGPTATAQGTLSGGSIFCGGFHRVARGIDPPASVRSRAFVLI